MISQGVAAEFFRSEASLFAFVDALYFLKKEYRDIRRRKVYTTMNYYNAKKMSIYFLSIKYKYER